MRTYAIVKQCQQPRKFLTHMREQTSIQGTQDNNLQQLTVYSDVLNERISTMPNTQTGTLDGEILTEQPDL